MIEIIKLAKKHQNIFFDTAGVEIDNNFIYKVRKIGVKRIMFGSDFPWHNPNTQIEKIIRPKLTNKEKELILGKNAKKIYSIN